MNTLTTGWPSGPATSVWTISSPWSMAACWAISLTRSTTDDSMSRSECRPKAVIPDCNCRRHGGTPNLRPKEKVGQNPPDNASEDPSKKMNYTVGVGFRQGGISKARGSTGVRVPTLVGSSFATTDRLGGEKPG